MCLHKWATDETVSLQAHRNGERKFRLGFLRAEAGGIRVVAARRKRCTLCGEKATTVEVDWDDIRPLLPDRIQDVIEEYLAALARGERRDVLHSRRVTYKELWEVANPTIPWGNENFRELTRRVVGWVADIAHRDVSSGRPPRNSLVVCKDTGLPGHDWESWAQENGVLVDYPTPEAAQQACWDYPWPRVGFSS